MSTLPEGTHGLPTPSQIADKAFEVTYVTNALHYAEKLEFGHSKQAPAGMARIAVAEAIAELSVAKGEP